MKIVKNYLYNLLAQVLNVCIPLVTLPYVLRVLGPENMGSYVYASAVVQYFIFFGGWGMLLYGNKIIAYEKNDSNRLNSAFSSILSIQVIFTSLAILTFIIFIIWSSPSDKVLYYILIINLIGTAFDTTWLFYGIEEFGKITFRNLLVKTVSLAAIFLYVKNPNDLWTYAFIGGFSNAFAQILIFRISLKRVTLILPRYAELKKHILASSKLLFPQFLMLLYSTVDRFLIGSFLSNISLAIYDAGQKIIMMLALAVISLRPIMISRISSALYYENTVEISNNVLRSFGIVSILGFACIFGIIGISPYLIPLLFGNKYHSLDAVISLLSVTILFMGYGDILVNQLMVALGKHKGYLYTIITMTVLIIVLDIILIPIIGVWGAIAATVVAHFSILPFEYALTKKYVLVKKIFAQLWKYLVAGTIMFACIRLIGHIFELRVATVMIQILFGGSIYFLVLFLLRENLMSYFVNRFYYKVETSF